MKYSVLLDRLQNLTKRKISQSELCNVLGLKQSAMGNRQSRDSNFSDLEIKTIEHHYNVILSEQSELIEIEHIHINPSCGYGTVVLDEPDVFDYYIKDTEDYEFSHFPNYIAHWGHISEDKDILFFANDKFIKIDKKTLLKLCKDVGIKNVS